MQGVGRFAGRPNIRRSGSLLAAHNLNCFRQKQAYNSGSPAPRCVAQGASPSLRSRHYNAQQVCDGSRNIICVL